VLPTTLGSHRIYMAPRPRRRHSSYFLCLKGEIVQNIIGMGCTACIVHSFIQNTVDVSPFDIEALVVNIYEHFRVYAVHVTQLKKVLDFVYVEYKRVFQHGITRFVLLVPAINRMLHIFESLKSYFISKEQCPLLQEVF
jgi:hypothetical protein